MVLLSMIRVFTGAGWRPMKIGVAAKEAPNACIREQFQDARIVTGCPISYISMPINMLSLAPSSNVDAAGESDKLIVESIAKTPAANLKLIMRSYLGDAMRLDAASDLYGTSSRSLQRMLSREGTTFRSLRDEVTYELASDLLTDRGIPIADIAQSLGYRHPTHFTRAFRRIAGVSPRRYRAAAIGDNVVH